MNYFYTHLAASASKIIIFISCQQQEDDFVHTVQISHEALDLNFTHLMMCL